MYCNTAIERMSLAIVRCTLESIQGLNFRFSKLDNSKMDIFFHISFTKIINRATKKGIFWKNKVLSPDRSYQAEIFQWGDTFCHMVSKDVHKKCFPRILYHFSCVTWNSNLNDTNTSILIWTIVHSEPKPLLNVLDHTYYSRSYC